jgi:signal transduction histidine kinase
MAGDHTITRPLAPLSDGSTYRTLLFLVTALPLGGIALGVLIAGWALTASLAITPAVVVVLVAFRLLVWALARVESALARELLGVATSPPGSPASRGFWRRASTALTDRAFWKQQAYLILRFPLGWALAILELALLGGGLTWVSFPIWYRWGDVELFNGWPVDTFGRSLLLVVPGFVLFVIGLQLVRPLGSLYRGLARGLLGSDALQPVKSPAEARIARRVALTIHAASFAGINAITTVIWGLTSRGYFWPFWPLISLGLFLAIHTWTVVVAERPELFGRRQVTRGLVLHTGISAALFLFLVAVWADTWRGYFWPVWPLVALAVALGGHALVAVAGASRRGELTERIAELETSRAGAVDVQETELRRIERDLHDGAQARLVALGMSIGMAEQKLGTDPEAARAMLVEARRGAREALEELRDLARGIHPPVLTDRGLEAAVGTLADRSPLPVSVAVELAERPPAAVETAAYFVVAEALANATKHSLAEHIAVRVRRADSTLIVEVSDDGRGGANPAGGGLTGLRHRVEALDGTLQVTSPVGGPTTVKAELPCVS